jgi:predicted kinase
MLQSIVLIGIPGSGKTTFARQYQISNPSFHIIERDDARLRMMKEQSIQSIDDIRVDFSKWDWKREPEITEMVYNDITVHFEHGHNLILSDTNLNVTHRSTLISFLRTTGFDTSLKFIEIELEIAIQRDSLRQYPVGEKIITELYNDWLQQFHKTRILR